MFSLAVSGNVNFNGNTRILLHKVKQNMSTTLTLKPRRRNAQWDKIVVLLHPAAISVSIVLTISLSTVFYFDQQTKRCG